MFSGYESISQNNSSSILNNLTNEVSQCFAFLNLLALILRESVVLLFYYVSIVFLTKSLYDIINFYYIFINFSDLFLY